MAYIIPDSDIILLKDVHIDPSYTETIYFATPEEQFSYFYNLLIRPAPYTGVRLTDYSYLRVNNNVIQVEGKAEELYNCNYMLFRNTAYGNKWFYAFILQADYVNDNTVNLTFDIDVIQTWLFETVLEPCFVEREHQETDEAGDNLLAEPVDVGEIICQNIRPLINIKAYDVVIAYAPDTSWN